MRLLLKRKSYPNGTIREWQGVKYIKKNNKWIPLPQNGRTQKDDKGEKHNDNKMIVDATKGSPRKSLDKGTGPGEKPKQPVNDLNKVYKLVDASREDFNKWTDNIHNKFASVIVNRMDRTELKDFQRAARKITDKEGADSVLDIDGKTLVVKSEKDAARMVAYLRDLPEVVRIKDRFVTPTNVGYRDFLLNVKTPNGAIVELQVTTEALLDAKSHGHLFYEMEDQLQKAFDQGKIKEDVFEKTRLHVIHAQRELYDNAYLAGASFKASEVDTLTPLRSISAILQESGAGASVLSEKTRKTFESMIATTRSSHEKHSALGKSVNFFIRSSAKSSIDGFYDSVNRGTGMKDTKHTLSLGKAKPYPDGVIRVHNGKKYKKVDGGWIPVQAGMTASEKWHADQENNKSNKSGKNKKLQPRKIAGTQAIYDTLHKIATSEPIYLDDVNNSKDRSIYNSLTKENLITWTHVANEEYKAELTDSGKKAHDAGHAYFSKVKRESLTSPDSKADASLTLEQVDAFEKLYAAAQDRKKENK